MANPYVAGPLAGAGESLVGALLGGGDIQEKARNTEQMRLYTEQGAQATLDKKITEAYLERDKRQAQQAYEANLTPLMGAEAAKVAAGFAVGGKANLEQVQRFGMRAQVPGAMEADGVTPGNALVMALGNKLNPAVSVVGGQNVRGMYGAAPVITNTDETLSKIIENEAQAGASNARAGVYDAQSAAGGWNPNTGGGKPPALTPANEMSVRAALGEKVTDKDGKTSLVIDPVKLNNFNTYWTEQAAVDPRYADGDFALAQFRGKKFATQPMLVAGQPMDVAAGYTPEMVNGLAGMIQDRLTQGLPPLTKVQKRQILMNAKRNGGQLTLDQTLPGGVVWNENGVRSLIPANATTRSKIAKTQPNGNEPSPIQPTAGAPRKIANEAAYRALASGTRFIAPDGTVRVKP